MILVLICSDLQNCLRNVGTIVITTESGSNRFEESFSLNIFSQKPLFFAVLLCMATPDFSSSIEDINNMARVSRLSFYFLLLWSY